MLDSKKALSNLLMAIGKKMFSNTTMTEEMAKGNVIVLL